MIDPDSAAEEIGISTKAYKKLCTIFINTADNDVKMLRLAAESGDREELRNRAHHIKGAAVNLEFTTLARLAEKIQLNAFETGFASLETDLGLLYNEYKKVRTEIEVIL